MFISEIVKIADKRVVDLLAEFHNTAYSFIGFDETKMEVTVYTDKVLKEQLEKSTKTPSNIGVSSHKNQAANGCESRCLALGESIFL